MVSYSQCNVLTGHHCVLQIIWSVISWYLSYHLSFQKNMGVLNFFLCVYILVITVFTLFRLLTDFVCLYTYEFWLSLCKIVRSSVILLLPLFLIVVVIFIFLFYLCTITMHLLYENKDNSLINAHEGETIIATQFWSNIF